MNNKYNYLFFRIAILVLILAGFCFTTVYAEAGSMASSGASSTTTTQKRIQGPTGVSLPPRSTTSARVRTPSPIKTAAKTPVAVSNLRTPTKAGEPRPVSAPPVVSPSETLPSYVPDIKSNQNNKKLSKNLNGYYFYIAAPWDASEDVNINKEAIEAFKKEYNCRVIFLNLSKDTIYNMLLKSSVTGVSYFDAILTDASNILVNFEPLGLLEEFNKYMTQEELNNIPKSYKNFLSKEDKLYGIPAYAPDFSGLWINNNLLKKYNINNPVNSFNSNKWTWEAFNSFVNECYGSKTPNSDNTDLYGITTSSEIYLPILEANGGSLYRWTGNKFISGAGSKSSVNGLTLAKNLFNTGYISLEYEKRFYKEEAAILAGEISMYPDIKKHLTSSEFTFLAYPMNKETNTHISTANYANCASIVKTSKYPAHTAELLKIIYGGDNFNKRIDNYIKDNKLTNQISTMYKKMLENFTIDYSRTFDTSLNLNKTIMSLLKNGTFSKVSAESSLVPVIEKLIKQKSKDVDLSEVQNQIKW